MSKTAMERYGEVRLKQDIIEARKPAADALLNVLSEDAKNVLRRHRNKLPWIATAIAILWQPKSEVGEAIRRVGIQGFAHDLKRGLKD